MQLVYRPDTIIERPNAFETTGKLVLFAGNVPGDVFREWFACSGGWGKGSIPHGIYLLSKAIKLPEAGNDAYKKESFPWVIHLTPTRFVGRDALALHPDGNIPGTLGCIGIMQDDIDCYEVLSASIAKVGKLYLKVF